MVHTFKSPDYINSGFRSNFVSASTSHYTALWREETKLYANLNDIILLQLSLYRYVCTYIIKIRIHSHLCLCVCLSVYVWYMCQYFCLLLLWFWPCCSFPRCGLDWAKENVPCWKGWRISREQYIHTVELSIIWFLYQHSSKVCSFQTPNHINHHGTFLRRWLRAWSMCVIGGANVWVNGVDTYLNGSWLCCCMSSAGRVLRLILKQ